jgi:hypothetical protein
MSITQETPWPGSAVSPAERTDLSHAAVRSYDRPSSVAEPDRAGRRMLTLRKRPRIWAARVVVAAYALAVLLPSLAFSFDRDVSIVHSLTEAHGGLLIPHYHHDDADHKNPDQHFPGEVHHCCGALALPALLPPAEMAFADQVCPSLISSVPQDHHAGCGPARLDRPPRPSSLI